MEKYTDITKTGTKGLKGLKGINTQSLKVDAVSGATNSSKVILKATVRALERGNS